MENITKDLDFSIYKNVFCDSIQAIEWAYKNGLPKDALIRTNSPAVLLRYKNNNISNIEERWTVDELDNFQSTIQDLTNNVFDLTLNIPDIERELALTVALSAHQFQKVLYKASCLEESDFTEHRLFIYVDGKVGPAGNIMNSPWDKLLSCNSLFSMVSYTLLDDEWNMLTTKGVSYLKRLNVAGYETIIFRIAIKLMKKLPKWLFKKELLMPNENELNIELASLLALHGVRITKIQPSALLSSKYEVLNINNVTICDTILPVMRRRVEKWVTPSAVETTMSMFESYLKEQISQFKLLMNGWDEVITKDSGIKQAVLVNSPSNISGYALSCVCKKNNTPLFSSQHGVTVEISKKHSILRILLDSTVSDIVFSYNSKAADIEKSSHFNNAKHYAVGMPMRLMRMKSLYTTSKFLHPIVYISTNLYHMGFSISSNTDYRNAICEKKLVNKVLSRLPHKVCYKTYPEDNRRYADKDPVLSDVDISDNIEIFSEKIDMRYLVSKYRVLVTTCATSTLAWPVMSGKPVVFINQKNKSPLTDDALKSLSKGIFVFNDQDDSFHDKLLTFLSQPIEEIERLWKEKRKAHKEMIREYFSMHKSGAGRRAAKIILSEYF
jgi:hypothetical protein